MATKTYDLSIFGDDYYTNDGLGGIPGTIAIGNSNSGSLNGLPLVNVKTDDSAIPLGGGAFLTAAHVFDAYAQSPVTGLTLEYRWTNASINDSPVTGTVTELEPYDAQASFIGIKTGHPAPDLATFQSAAAVSPSDLSPLMVFTDPVSASQFLSGQTFSCSGIKTPYVSGTYGGMVTPGVFDVNAVTAGGDSGGAASILGSSGASYVVGVESYGGTYDTKYSYLNVGDYEAAINEIAPGTSFSSMAPDIIYGGGTANQLVRTSQRQADIITNGNNDIILVGSGGGLVNTGTGQNDVVFLPGADGQSDPGTAIVVPAGTMTLVGGNANDKLVLPTDRLETVSGQEPTSSSVSDTSSTIQLLGGFNQSGEQSVYGFGPELGPGSYDGNYMYSVLYSIRDGDLCVITSTGTWDSKIWIKNFTNGDFGINLSEDSVALGEDPAATQADADQQIQALTGTVQAQQNMDDDPTVHWQSSNPRYQYGDIYNTYFDLPDSTVTVSPSALATDLSDVIANTQGDTTPFGESSPPSNTAPNVVTVAAFEAEQTQLDAEAGGFTVLDTAANIAQGLNALDGDNSITAITVSDAATSPLSITLAQALSDSACPAPSRGRAALVVAVVREVISYRTPRRCRDRQCGGALRTPRRSSIGLVMRRSRCRIMAHADRRRRCRKR